ncbi:MAG TPA: bifunctional oligoribonuclease/PAP phosphatase NrnA [Vicinamibacterales bacterium]|jgi:bifunctional oligoribonuclease and PAP phosphatase NrnA|nr:bifunctional oligoribonuclease/PAP phosphatase NrnA [Vicinamibacterales bacterium]
MTATTDVSVRARVADEIRRRQRFVLSSHVRPDGDAIGSQLAMAYALWQMGKDVRLVNRDAPPGPLRVFPGVSRIEVANRIDDPGDAVIVMECGDLTRTGVEGFDRGFVINIDHHLGNANYGAVNWFDASAAACGEMVFDLVKELGVPLTLEIATHVYIAILTDTGSFHYSSISPRTFDICRQCMEAGINPPAIAGAIYDSNNLGRLKLFGAVMSKMELDSSGRVATVYVDQALARDCGGTYEDTEGIVNLPLTVKEIEAVAFFKEAGADDWRVSMRSKGEVDVNAIAKEFGGGGHKNASGCSATGRFEDLKLLFQRKLVEQIEAADKARA